MAVNPKIKLLLKNLVIFYSVHTANQNLQQKTSFKSRISPSSFYS